MFGPVKNIVVKILILFSISLFFHNCEEPENVVITNEEDYNSTLNMSSVGNGSTGQVQDYFYDFDDAIDASFFMYNRTRFNYSYDQYLSIYTYEPPQMSMKNFPDYLLNVSSDSAQFTVRHKIDTLIIGEDTISSSIGAVVQDSFMMTSTQFKNLLSIDWDLESGPSLQRYKMQTSSWVQKDSMIHYADTSDFIVYQAVLDTPLIDNGIMFVDTSEWRDTSYTFINDSLPYLFTTQFEFERTQLSSDSLIYRINTDCNDNNQWDLAEVKVADYNNDGDSTDWLSEVNDGIDYNNDGSLDNIIYEFIDRGNNILDPQETYYDMNNNGVRDLNELYQDRNCNNKWDDEEIVDSGNGQYDDIEQYTSKDADGDGENEKHLYLIGSIPNNVLVDWTEESNPEIMINIDVGDSLTNRWGVVFNNIIETVSYVNTKQQAVSNVDSIITLYTNDIVGHITTGSQSPEDYYITKTDWVESSSGQEERKYDYQIFSENNHINQLVYKNYFLPPGFYQNQNQFNNGFWHKNYLENEIYLYTYNGLIRDGEHIDTAYYDTTNIAIYLVQKSFDVERSEVTVPAARQSFLDNEDGSFTCLRDNSIVFNSAECLQVDTTFSDCFKITQEMNMTMIGSGVEYGQKVYTWLAKDHGMVKSDMYIRWTENPFFEQSSQFGEVDESGKVWSGYSRIELAKLDIEQSGNVFRELLNPSQIISLSNIGNTPEFDYEPMKISNQSGFHTINFEESE